MDDDSWIKLGQNERPQEEEDEDDLSDTDDDGYDMSDLDLSNLKESWKGK